MSPKSSVPALLKKKGHAHYSGGGEEGECGFSASNVMSDTSDVIADVITDIFVWAQLG